MSWMFQLVLWYAAIGPEFCYIICYDFHLCVNPWVSCSRLFPVLLVHSSVAVWFYWFVSVSFREGSGTPLQYSCLENSMDGGAWWTTVHGVAKSQTRLSDFTFTFHFHALEKEMAPHSSVLAWRIPGTGCLVGCRLRGCTESDTTEAT